MFYPMIAGPASISGYASVTATEARSAAREAQTDVELLRHDVDRLLMIAEAMWSLLKQKEGYTDDTLTNLIVEIEKRKVVVDGIVSKDPPVNCPSCGRANMARRALCIYCGQPLMTNPFAR